MQNPKLRPLVGRILLRAGVVELVVLAVIGFIGYRSNWFNTPINVQPFSNALFITGLFVGIAGGFTVGGVRQMQMGSGAFIALQSIGTESDGNPGAKARLFGFAGFLKTFTTPLALGLAAVFNVVVAVAISGQ